MRSPCVPQRFEAILVSRGRFEQPPLEVLAQWYLLHLYNLALISQHLSEKPAGNEKRSRGIFSTSYELTRGETEVFANTHGAISSLTKSAQWGRDNDPRVSVWISSDPALGKFIPEGKQTSFPKDELNVEKLPGMGGIYNPINSSVYAHAHLNPIKITDPDGNAGVLALPGMAVNPYVVAAVLATAAVVAVYQNREAIKEAATTAIEVVKTKFEKPEMVPLYRAVAPAELASIRATGGRFTNPPGNEVKYFSTTPQGAMQYGQMAQQTYKDGPYSLVGTSIPKAAITPDMVVPGGVDRGIPTIVVPTPKLPLLTPAVEIANGYT